MKKRYKLENLGCANCAQKMEERISKLSNVNECNISFFTQKLTIDVNGDVPEDFIADIQKIITKIEPDCKILEL